MDSSFSFDDAPLLFEENDNLLVEQRDSNDNHFNDDSDRPRQTSWSIIMSGWGILLYRHISSTISDLWSALSTWTSKLGYMYLDYVPFGFLLLPWLPVLLIQFVLSATPIAIVLC